jgi:hypothetical protein
MSNLFKGISNFFGKLFRPKKPADWIEEGERKVANPKNPTPLDPSNPWIT